jgi:hypothetical protein
MSPSLLSSYPKKTDRFDEMLADDGSIRPSWRAFVAHLDAATAEQMRHRVGYVRQRILENGVTYNVYADPKGADRPWELDPLPLILSPAEWQQLAAAVAQRARLLNAVLKDLYGPQELLKDGSLPAALVFGHNNFLWPCQGDTARRRHLSAPLRGRPGAFAPNGRWWVIADRTQAPSGRRLFARKPDHHRPGLSRAVPRSACRASRLVLSRPCRTRLAYWAARGERGAADRAADARPVQRNLLRARLSGALSRLSPGRGPRSDGPRRTCLPAHTQRLCAACMPSCAASTTITAIRSNCAALRRSGIPGLLQAVRAGNVLVANALGSGLLESAALPGFLPGICKTLLGEPLQMPSVATWWCGEEAALEFTIEHLDRAGNQGLLPFAAFRSALRQ